MTNLEIAERINKLRKHLLDQLELKEQKEIVFRHTPNGLGEPNLIAYKKGEEARKFLTFYVEEGDVCLFDGETCETDFYCTISEMESAFDGFEKINVCEDCNGEGYTEYGPVCSKPASMCCGGCYQKIECECENKLFS